jgi:hypothetical protein
VHVLGAMPMTRVLASSVRLPTVLSVQPQPQYSVFPASQATIFPTTIVVYHACHLASPVSALLFALLAKMAIS